MKIKQRNILRYFQRLLVKYRVSILNESTLEDIFSFTTNKLNAILLLIGSVILFIALILLLIIGTPLKSYLPGYLNVKLRSELVENYLKLDSITAQNSHREYYLQNLQRILSGEMPQDSIVPLDSVVIIPIDSLPSKGPTEKEFVEKFQDEEKYNLTILNKTNLLGETTFYPPVKGVISNSFDPVNNQFGVKILCANNTPVISPLDGTIIYLGFTVNDKWIVQIQHSDNYISIFKNIEKPIRKIGDKVPAGKAIASLGTNTKGLGEPILQYELWYKGEAIDPQTLMGF